MVVVDLPVRCVGLVGLPVGSTPTGTSQKLEILRRSKGGHD